MKRLLFILALVLLTIPAAAFSDVEEGVYYAEAVEWAVEAGITTGKTTSTFSPDELCSRGQILTFLWRAVDAPDPDETIEIPYEDVAKTAHYYKPVLWALESGILEPSALLIPGDPCTRGETMLYLWRLAGCPKAPTAGFTDVDISAKYAPAVSWAVNAGVTEGRTETTFHPDDTCTRGQIVTFLYRNFSEKAPRETDTPERPIQTLYADGNAYSLGLDASAFISDRAYEAHAQVDVYSEQEAVITMQAPFPLFQARDYSVRFGDPVTGATYVFSYTRWDEAFEGVLDWEGEHYVYRFSELTAHPQEYVLEVTENSDDRMGGTVTWRVTLPRKSTFRFDQTSLFQISCEISTFD